MNTLIPIQHRKKKYCFENLVRFVECDEDLLTPALKATKTRSRRGDCAFYGYLPKEFPLHYTAFRNMHDQELNLSTSHHVSNDFELNSQGFINFILAVGPVPSSLQHPILVRKDPSLGFISGNLKWENAQKFRPVSIQRARACRS